MDYLWVVALASLIPGLGFVIQSKFREAMLSVSLMLVLLIVYFFALGNLSIN